MTDTSRRRFVRIATATAAVGLAGCSEGSGEDEDTEDAMDGTEAMDDGMTEEGMTDAMTEDGMTEGEMTDAEMTDAEMTDAGMIEPTDPEEAPRASIDRFSEEAGTLMVRSDENDLPEPDEAIDFDQGPFITTGLSPEGETIEYYNFDVQPTAPAPIYVLFRQGEDEPVEDQLNIVNVVPGDDGYNDFWQVHRVTVPSDYEANTITSAAELMEGDYEIEPTDTIKNCPVVPEGSTASKRYGDGEDDLVEGWYDGHVVSYFLFEEDDLSTSGDDVPLSPIYVTFNTNPGEEGGGPPSGFMTEDGSDQTHNVVATMPGDDGYSPLWMVNVYDNADFDDVSDLDSATEANVLATDAAHVNCPVVSEE